MHIAMCSVIAFSLFSCTGENGNNPDTPTGGGEETKGYFIKHPWNNGSWEWRQMSPSGNSYTYTGIWGGVGVNINTSANDSGAKWYPEGSISGASSLSVGDNVTFTFTPASGNNGLLSVKNNSEGNENPGGGNDNPGGGGTDNPGGGTEQGSAPNAPTNLSGSMAGSANTGFRVNLSWGYVSDADSYNIYRSSSEYGSYSKIGTSKTYSYTDNSPYDGDNYYKVSAVNSYGESEKSSSTYVSVDKYAYKPDFSSVKGSISDGKVKVSWSTKSGAGYGEPEKVKAFIYDPNDGTTSSQTYTGSSAKSGSHSWPCAECYKDEFGKIQIKVEVSNQYGTNSHSITYYDGKWIGNF